MKIYESGWIEKSVKSIINQMDNDFTFEFGDVYFKNI